MQVLRLYDLDDQLNKDPRKLVEQLQKITDRDPTSEKVYAMAELTFLGANKYQKKDPQVARDLYCASVLHAYRYLFDPKFGFGRNAYDPQFRGACDFYNCSLEAAMRTECKTKSILPGQTVTIQTSNGPWELLCQLRGGQWRAEEFERFDFVSSYEIQGLTNHYHTFGLGVPLIAVRRNYDGEPAATRYYPKNLSFPVTAFLRPVRAGAVSADPQPFKQQALLELYDPLVTNDLMIGKWRIPLESDLSTPLAYFLSDLKLDDVAWEGFLRPENLFTLQPGRSRPLMGLYMTEPYQPGKIPVVMVHGLWSSPMTWMEMFNDLRSVEEIRDRYQFWFYLYPSAQPFWISAGQMRRDLAEARKTLDPESIEPALDQMVLIGHSMGGLVSKLQTINSSGEYWKLVSNRPFEQIKASPELRNKMEQSFFFQPNVSVRRVITVATPHQGSTFSNQTTQWLLDKMIRMPQFLVHDMRQLYHDNPDAFGDKSLMRIETSIDSLSPSSPIFPVMKASRRPSWVKFHNVIGHRPKNGIFSAFGGTDGDGVVSLDSAQIPDVESELIVPADHVTIQSHPLTVLEVRRILMEHLAELEAFPQQAEPVVRTVALPDKKYQ